MTHSSAELKRMARTALNGKWGSAAAFTFVYVIVSLGLSMITSLFDSPTSFVGSMIYWLGSVIVSLITGLFSVGCSYYFLNICRGRKYGIRDLFAAFRMNPDRFLIVSLITSGISLLSTMPTYFWTPTTEEELFSYSIVTLGCIYIGTIISLILNLFFALSNYLLLDFQELGAIESLRMSAYLMKGNKGRYFYISLSFVGWIFLAMFTLGIALLWIEPYMSMTITYFYEDILVQTNKRQKEADVETVPTEDDFGDE